MSKKLLRETTYTSDDFDRLFAPVGEALKRFGSTISASAKLIGNDVAMFMKFTLHWKTRSLSSQKALMKEWGEGRKKHLKTISDNQAAMMEGLGADKYAMMAIFPGVFWSESALSGVEKVFSPNTRAMIGQYGMNKMPIIGPLFDGEYTPDRNGFWHKMTSMDEDPASEKGAKELTDTIVGHLRDEYGMQIKPPEKQGLLKRAFYGINDIFLFSVFDSTYREGDVLLEGEETDKEKEIESLKRAFLNMLPDLMEENWPVDRKAYVEEHKKVFESVIGTVEKVLFMNTSLATTDDPDEFFKILNEETSKHKELKDIDAGKLKAEFDKMVETLGGDEKVISELRKDLEKAGELEKLQEGEENASTELSEKEKPIFEKQLKKIALDNVKGGFLPAFKEGAIDLYDDVRFKVTDGLQEETMKGLEKEAADNEIGMQYLKQIREFQKRLDASLSKLK